MCLQDTVVALQALALYSTLVFSPGGSSTVTVQSPSGQLTFDVNQNNKLLYQERALLDVTGKYNLEVKGTACVSMQVSGPALNCPSIGSLFLLMRSLATFTYYWPYSG